MITGGKLIALCALLSLFLFDLSLSLMPALLKDGICREWMDGWMPELLLSLDRCLLRFGCQIVARPSSVVSTHIQ